MNISLPDISHSLFLVKGMQLHETMQRDIQLFRQKGLDNESLIQGCFDIANNYRAKLNEEAALYSFENREDEVLFFKRIKPLFNAEAEYHTYCYHVEIFRKTIEDDDPLETELFYRRQLQRMEKFSREHRELYEYLMTEQTDKDAEWFTRLPNDLTSSFYDKQVGSWLAIRRYEVFIQEELQKLTIIPISNKEDES